MKTQAWLWLAVMAAAGGVGLAGGCQEKPKPVPMAVDLQSRISASMHPALHKTIAEYAAFIDSVPIRVEAYGLVGPLPNTGSRIMDPRIRDLLNNRFTEAGIGLYSTGTQNIDTDKILDSNQAAAVEVHGFIPPLARKGTTFDLQVDALPDSDATSLENGLLLFSDLKVIGLTLNGTDSAKIAIGRGPVFIPQPLDAAAGGAEYKAPADAARDLRSGRILGGGLASEDRPARLQLYNRNRMLTLLMERTINSHFPRHDKVADALDDSIVALHVPPEYSDDPMDFVDYVRHLYLTTEEPGFVEKRAQMLVDALHDPRSPHREIALALQGLGESIVEGYLRPNYTSSDPQVRFWCAKAGACMEDSDIDGMTVLQETVKDTTNPLRREAIMAMIEASRGHDTERSTITMMEMIRSSNTDERILAYHALLSMRSHAISSYNMGRKFVVDLVPADGPPLIYVLESGSPRIAFIGQIPSLPPGAVYISKDNNFTVSADVKDAEAPAGTGRVVTAASLGDAAPAPVSIDNPAPTKAKETVTLLWRPPLEQHLVPLRTVNRLPELIARATWVPDPRDPDYDASKPYIGASYQRITEMLATMCNEGMVDAKFVSQRAPDIIVNPTDLALQGRAEGPSQGGPSTQPATEPATQPMSAPATMPADAGSGRSDR